ncbi:MAG: hypothetical protein HDR88_18765 [Bacteroides sp.]|nr:hypothetical protein [Bacteroides sp.]
MKQKFIPFLGMLAFLTSCQSSYDEPAQELSLPSTPIEELTGIQHDIAVNILTNHFGGYTKGEPPTRASGQFSLTPYIVEGDTVMYVAQYQDGWEIYSASHATEMVLFSSDEGRFDINDPNLPEQLHFLIEENASLIRQLMKKDTYNVDPSWGPIAVPEEKIEHADVMALVDVDSNERTTINSGSVPPGHWVLINIKKLSESIDWHPSLTSTKWSQLEPWNKYSKYCLDKADNTFKHSPNGCSAVAIAQYLYFTHYKDGIPTSSAAYAISTSDGYDYTFPVVTSTNWDKMAKDSTNPGIDEVALLIGSIGRSINTTYGLAGSSTSEKDELRYLNSVYKNNTFTISDFNYINVRSSLANGYPVICSARSDMNRDGTPTEEKGHVFLVDGYREIVSTYRYTYGLVRDPLPAGATDPWIADLKDENGNIIVYAYTKQVEATSAAQSSISMNWGGEDSSYNYIYYSPYENWRIGDICFNLRHKMYERK